MPLLRARGVSLQNMKSCDVGHIGNMEISDEGHIGNMEQCNGGDACQENMISNGKESYHFQWEVDHMRT